MFTPFYDSNSQKRLDKKVKKSNSIHRILEDKANNKINSTPRYIYENRPSKKFYDLVRRDYHVKVYNWQSINNKVASKTKKKDIYNDTLVERVEINKYYGNGHIPKRFKK